MKRADRGKGRNRGAYKRKGHVERHHSKVETGDEDSSNVVQMSEMNLESSEDGKSVDIIIQNNKKVNSINKTESNVVQLYS